MDKQKLDLQMTEAAKTLLSYCAARTSNPFEAEDLAHDIILEIYQSVDHLRNEDAFYGFLWSVAGNVYKRWCKNKAVSKRCVWSDELLCADDTDEKENSNLYLLRRELSLLAARYRKTVILYYMQRCSCADIARQLSISESMVKYLLFKSRHILKEGMSMERNYGDQSYNPKELTPQFWGNGPNPCYHLFDSKISQNILFACYNDKLTEEQISLEIGVSLPYMEDRLSELLENKLLKKDGNRYCTNIVIFTADFQQEVVRQTATLRERIADRVQSAVAWQEAAVRAIGFQGSDMPVQTYRWQMTCFVLYNAIIERLLGRVQLTPPDGCYIWGDEKCENSCAASPFGFGVSNVVNKAGDYVQFMDFPLHGEMVHHFFYNRTDVTNVFLEIAKGHSQRFGENDQAVAAELIRKGYVCSATSGLSVNAPIFTAAQHRRLRELFSDEAERIAAEAEGLMDAVTAILKNHIPVHLKSIARDMACLRLLDDAISAPVSILHDRQFLLPYRNDGMLPTTYVILK